MSWYFAEFVIHNYGNSPAIVLEIYQYCIRSRGMAELIPFPPPQSNLQQTLVVGGMKESQPLVMEFPMGGIPEDSKDGIASEVIWVGFQLRYRDVFMNQFISTFCLAYNQSRATFSAYGGPKYNNRRKLTDEERRIAEARDI
jgi:hypothetical protein